jgi:Mitochondrial carrier protein
MQLKQSSDVNEQYKGTIAGIQKIIKDEGLTGLYKGFVLEKSINFRSCA